jgi:probable rRNA maturation factor
VKLVRVDRRSRWPADDAWDDAGALWTLLTQLCAPLAGSVWCAALVLVDDAEMAELNRRYRSFAAPTDVLSFAYLLPEGRGPRALAAGKAWAFRDLWWDPAVPAPEEASREIGEIVLAPAFIAERCARHGWDRTREWALLTVHGALHLLGWEHATPAARQAMRAAETELLARRDLVHPLRDEPPED